MAQYRIGTRFQTLFLQKMHFLGAKTAFHREMTYATFRTLLCNVSDFCEGSKVVSDRIGMRDCATAKKTYILCK